MSKDTWRVWDTGTGRVRSVKNEAAARNVQKNVKNIVILRPGTASPPGAAGYEKHGLTARIVDAILRRWGK